MHNPIIVDLGFGDAGKGTMVDYLAMPGSLVVRYNGGPQAAHNVVTSDGRHHTFAQFGSGTFVGAATHLSRFMLINPVNMLTEERHLDYLGVRNVFGRTTVDPRAVIVTPFHVAANRIKEIARSGNRHGSCGQGVGEARAYQLREDTETLVAGDLQDEAITAYVLNTIRNDMLREVEDMMEWAVADSAIGQQEWSVLNHTDLSPIIDAYTKWARLVEFRPDDWIGAKDGNLIFEGAQGVLLDETHGFAPHNTWTDTTQRNALVLAEEAGVDTEVLGVARTYMTRHGAGPLTTEQSPATEIHRIFAGTEAHNDTGIYQGAWRVGYLDLPLLRYAIDCCFDIRDIDALAVTHVDRVLTGVQIRNSTHYHEGQDVCVGYRWDDGDHSHHVTEIEPTKINDYYPVYEWWTDPPIAYAKHMAEDLGLPLAVASFGPTANDKETYVTA